MGIYNGGVAFFWGFERINFNPEEIGTSVKIAIVNIDALFYYSNFLVVKKHLVFQFG